MMAIMGVLFTASLAMLRAIPVQDVLVGLPPRFQGIRANNRPMPQVSVMPAKTSPAPTRAERTTNAGWTSQPSNAPKQTSNPAAIRTCRSSEIVFLPLNHRQATRFPSQSAALDVDDVGVACLEKFFTRLLTPAARTTDNIQWLVR